MRNFIFILCLSFILVSCEDSDSSTENFEAEELSSKSIVPEGVHLLSIENTNGMIRIIGSDTATHINFEVTRRVKSYRSSASASDHINDIQISYEIKSETVDVKVEHPTNNDLDYEVDFMITAPIIFDYRVLQGNGNININSVSRNLHLTLGNGNTDADVILLNDCTVRFETGNGNILLTIPAITDAGLLATVGNGSITRTNLPFESEVSTGSTFQGILGNGEGSIVVTVGNGSIDLVGY